MYINELYKLVNSITYSAIWFHLSKLSLKYMYIYMG